MQSLQRIISKNKAIFRVSLNPNIPINKAASISVGKQIQSRAGLYKMILTFGAIHIIGTYGSELFFDRQVTLGVTDYIENNKIEENSNFQVFGSLKVGSMKFKRGSLDTQFEITDFKQDLDVSYSGMNKFEFKEGETLVLTAYCPNIKQKNKVIATDYMTKHSMEVQNWEDKVGSSRQNYGLYKN